MLIKSLSLLCAAAAVLFSAQVRTQANHLDRAADSLDQALAQAGLSRSDLGWSARGWWTNSPKATLHRLPFYDDLQREPLAAVPFTRTLAQAVRIYLAEDLLSPAKEVDDRNYASRDATLVAGHGLYHLAGTAIQMRYPDPATYLGANVPVRQATLAEAILSLFHQAGEPTQFHTASVDAPLPDVEGQLRRRAQIFTPEVSRILGQLVLDISDAHRHAALAFAAISVEQRLAISRRMNMWNALSQIDGLDYADVSVFDDVARNWDEGSLWYSALKSTEALDRARLALNRLSKVQLGGLQSFDWETPLGWIRIRGTGNDRIEAATTDALLVVDLGGDDEWFGSPGSSSPTRLIGLALDLSGDDRYEGGIATQGAGIAGIGILLDAAGNDRYTAERYAQGAAQFGFGALFDLGGNNSFQADHSAQGSAAFGIGILVAGRGSDRYSILGNGQGFGGTGGVGLLADSGGNDVYRAEPEAAKAMQPAYGSAVSSSFAQGAGLGRRFGTGKGHSAAGGLGALIDIEGDDRYTVGGWGQGSGNWFGTGLLYDGDGRDTYEADIWAQAGAAHFSIGVLIDDGGDDTHLVRDIHGLAAAHDMSVALLIDRRGDDRYRTTKDGLGFSVNRSTAMLIDQEGDDDYRMPGSRPGKAGPDKRLVVSEDGTGTLTPSEPNLQPYFAYLTSVGLFLDMGGKDGYDAGLTDGVTWGDSPDSDNGLVRNVGVGMDLASGQIDWRPRADFHP